MTTTLTIRLPKEQRAALRKRAVSLRKTESELIRSLIERDLSTTTILSRVGELVGSVDLRRPEKKAHPLKEKLRKHNWRS
jgi:hypothetical protein